MLHYEIRLKRNSLHNDGINTIPALLRQAPNLIAKRLYIMALRPGEEPELENKTSAEAYMIITAMYPDIPKDKIRQQYFEELPRPNIAPPTPRNIYDNPIPLPPLEPITISPENNPGINQSPIFAFDDYDVPPSMYDSGSCH